MATLWVHWRSYMTLRAALTGIRLDVAELKADGRRIPLCIAISYEYHKANGDYLDSETVAIWKRGRFVWVDPLFRGARCSAKRFLWPMPHAIASHVW